MPPKATAQRLYWFMLKTAHCLPRKQCRLHQKQTSWAQLRVMPASPLVAPTFVGLQVVTPALMCQDPPIQRMSVAAKNALEAIIALATCTHKITVHWHTPTGLRAMPTNRWKDFMFLYPPSQRSNATLSPTSVLSHQYSPWNYHNPAPPDCIGLQTVRCV